MIISLYTRTSGISCSRDMVETLLSGFISRCRFRQWQMWRPSSSRSRHLLSTPNNLMKEISTREHSPIFGHKLAKKQCCLKWKRDLLTTWLLLVIQWQRMTADYGYTLMTRKINKTNFKLNVANFRQDFRTRKKLILRTLRLIVELNFQVNASSRFWLLVWEFICLLSQTKLK